jgi:hypothetical protein
MYNHLVPELQTDKSGTLDHINFLTVSCDLPNPLHNSVLKIAKNSLVKLPEYPAYGVFSSNMVFLTSDSWPKISVICRLM